MNAVYVVELSLTHCILAQLPPERLRMNLPSFTYCGVDYNGLSLVKQRRAVVKRYGVLFICLVVGATHFDLSITNSLEVDTFILALRRFLARRRPIAEMYSNNSTKFVAGSSELRNDIRKLGTGRSSRLSIF